MNNEEEFQVLCMLKAEKCEFYENDMIFQYFEPIKSCLNCMNFDSKNQKCRK